MSIRIEEIKGAVFWFTAKNGQENAAYMHTVMSKNPEGVMVKIVHLFTEKKYRRQGYARQLVESLMNELDKKVNLITTSWKQSSEEGRKLMLACGFKRLGDDFVWQRVNLVLPKTGIEVPVSKDIIG